MPTTWLEWKHKASLLENQWRQFQDMQPKAATNWMFLFCPPPAIISTTATSSSSSRTSAPAASSVPQPMDLDHTHPMKRDPCHGLCFNCGKPGHIVKVCQGPCACHTCDSATLHSRIRPDAGLTTSYRYEWTDRPWWADTRDGLLAAQNGSFCE